MTNSNWSYNSLFQKAKIFIDRALEVDRESSLFPFWCSLSLELLGRATLSKIHPVLIADPREGSNILYAFGYPLSKGHPKTIGAKTIFLRLNKIVPEFTAKEEKFCLLIIEKRNEELHTGTPVFENFNTSEWLAHFYSVLKVLLEHQNKTLADFIGQQESETARQMIAAYNVELVSIVKDRIKTYKKVFNDLDSEEKAEAVEKSEQKKLEFIVKSDRANYSKNLECPCCGNQGILCGSYISTSAPIADEDGITEHRNILPTEFYCFTCNFKLKNYGELLAINLGGQFTIMKNFDPIEFYDIDPIEAANNLGIDLLDAAREYGHDFDSYIEGHFEYGND